MLAQQAAPRRRATMPPPRSFIRERDLDWSWWPLDGQQGPSRDVGAVETYGLLNTTWDGVAYPPLIDVLRTLP